MRAAATTPALDLHSTDEMHPAREAWREGDPARARVLLARQLQACPTDAAALHLQGVMALAEGAIDEAIDHLFRAVEHANTNPDYWCDLGRALQAKPSADQAREAYLQALNLQPEHLDSVFHLAGLLRECGQAQEALQFYSALMERDATYRGGWHHTGLVLLDLGHREDARKCFERELTQDATHVAARLQLGEMLRAQGRLLEAVSLYRDGLPVAPPSAELSLQLGTALADLGSTAEAIDLLRAAVRVQPGLAAAHHGLICALDRDPCTDTRHQQAERTQWVQRCLSQVQTTLARPRDAQPYRRLRIGYVAADFAATGHAKAYAPLLLEYDRTHFEVHCFATVVQDDALTAWLKPEVSGFHPIASMDDAAAARFIDAQDIDILVDLTGHATGSRLGVFAHRPAPIQITGWGGINGSGMPEMDFIAADDVHLPPADGAHFTETRLEVPAVLSYDPIGPLPEVLPPPFLARGFVTFGSYAAWEHITDSTVSLWARVLAAVRGAELYLTPSPAAGETGTQWMRERFARVGVSPRRVQFLRGEDRTAHFQRYAQLDIQLDTYPQGAPLTLLDGIAMGVPTLTISGATPAARLSTALLYSVGDLGEWVAHDENEFVASAVRWAADPQPLRPLRLALRNRLTRSPVGNTLAYVRALEHAYRQVWKDHTANFSAVHALGTGEIISAP